MSHILLTDPYPKQINSACNFTPNYVFNINFQSYLFCQSDIRDAVANHICAPVPPYCLVQTLTVASVKFTVVMQWILVMCSVLTSSGLILLVRCSEHRQSVLVPWDDRPSVKHTHTHTHSHTVTHTHIHIHTILILENNWLKIDKISFNLTLFKPFINQNSVCQYCIQTVCQYCTQTVCQYCTQTVCQYCTQTVCQYCTQTVCQYCTQTVCQYCTQTVCQYCTQTVCQYCTQTVCQYCTQTVCQYCTQTVCQYCT
jgi:hypothetical protein